MRIYSVKVNNQYACEMTSMDITVAVTVVVAVVVAV